VSHNKHKLIAGFLFVSFLVLVFIFSIHALGSINQDIGRHLTLGKIIWQTHHIPTTNLFSYTAPDWPFINHHWLAEVAIYLGERWVGLRGLITAKALIIALAFGLTLLAAWRKARPVSIILFGLLAIAMMLERTDLRPEIFSFLFLAWYLFVLYRQHDQATGWLLWTLIPVQLLWVNTHIYFFIGPLWYLLFLLADWIKKAQITPSTRQDLVRGKTWLVGAGVVLMNFINPFGWRGAIYPLQVFSNYGYSIAENKGPLFLRAWGFPQFTTYVLFFCIALLVLGIILNWRSWREHFFAISSSIVAGIFALLMVRNFPLFALTLIPAGALLWTEIMERWRGEKPQTQSGKLVLLLVVVLSIVSVLTGEFYQRFGLSRQFGLEVPVGAQAGVDFVRTNKLRGPIFNNFDVGSFLIWRLPEEPVFIDGRPEAYPADFIQKTYIPMQEDPALWKKYSEQYNIQYVFWDYHDITPWSQQFIKAMLNNSAWPLVYRDDTILIFVRANPHLVGE